MTYSINNSLPNRGSGKSNLYGLLGSALSCLTLFLIMWFYVMPLAEIQQPVQEEGLMISFGNSDEGGGQGDELMGAPNENPAPSKVEETTTTKAEPVTKPVQTSTVQPKSTSQDYISQSETSLAIAEKRKKDQDKANQLAIENARIANEKRIADQKRKEQGDKIDNLVGSAMSGSLGKSSTAGNGKGMGTGSGEGADHQGDIFGKGYSSGPHANVNGRTVVGQEVEPTNIFQEGKAVVTIKVNGAGKVIYAKCTSGNISDSKTKQLVEAAAYATKFTPGNNEAVGVIVYNLVFSSH
jgi:hypothetical protein